MCETVSPQVAAGKASMDPTSSRAFRRPYVAILVLLLALLLLVRFIYLRAPGASLTQSLLATAAQVADALIGATVAALGVVFLISVIFPGRDEAEDVRVLSAREIGPFIRDEASRTREWLVRVRTAAYFRARTLPSLAQASSANNRTISIRMIAMDPRDVELSKRHLQTRSSPGTQWSEKRLRLEICATILTCALHKKLTSRLDISVRLVRTLWISSLDISSDYALVAGPHSGHPAYAFNNKSESYDTFRSEFEISFTSGEAVDLTALDSTDFEDLDKIKIALGALGLSQVADDLDDLKAIRTMIREPERSNEYR